jgi:glycosyltransferase involved in cell wall biosynthesis
VLRTPIDTKFYNSTQKADPDIVQTTIFSVGVSGRDYPTLLRAMSKLPHIPCEISATSAWVDQKTVGEDVSVPTNVRIVAYNHPSVIREAYTRSRFVVIPIQPATTQWSAGSISALQPQAMGKPVIATKMPGLSDYVLDGETGLLVEGNHPGAMAEAIDYLWKNPDKAAAMGSRAKEWVIENFTLDQWLNRVGTLLNEI